MGQLHTAAFTGWLFTAAFIRSVSAKDCELDPNPLTSCQTDKCVLSTPTVVAVVGKSANFTLSCVSDCTDLNDALTAYNFESIDCPAVTIDKITFKPEDLNLTYTELEDGQFQFTLFLLEEQSELFINIQVAFEATCRNIKGKGCNILDEFINQCIKGCHDLTAKPTSESRKQISQLRVTSVDSCPCPKEKLGNGICDAECSSEDCEFDGGDCKAPYNDDSQDDEDINHQSALVLVMVLVGAGCLIALASLCFCFLRTHRVFCF